MTTTRSLVMAVVILVAVGAGCAGSDEVADSAATAESTSTSTTSPLFIENDPDSTSSDGLTSTTATESPTTLPVDVGVTTPVEATVPDEGVPGLDSDDEFCRAWSEFAGSFQALSVGWLAQDANSAAALELAAAAVLLDSRERLNVSFPAEIAAERDTVIEALLGPMARRAQRAQDQLTSSGVDGAAIDQLGAAWLAALTQYGLDDPSIAIVVPLEDPNALAQFQAAIAAYASSTPPIQQDPSLATDASYPGTEQYLSDNCPDRGILAGNDV